MHFYLKDIPPADAAIPKHSLLRKKLPRKTGTLFPGLFLFCSRILPRSSTLVENRSLPFYFFGRIIAINSEAAAINTRITKIAGNP